MLSLILSTLSLSVLLLSIIIIIFFSVRERAQAQAGWQGGARGYRVSQAGSMSSVEPEVRLNLIILRS